MNTHMIPIPGPGPVDDPFGPPMPQRRRPFPRAQAYSRSYVKDVA